MKTIERNIKKAVVYQIYVKSFCDSNGDGIGDLPGIISKLDYLEDLGVDYLWLTPIYPSPQHDNGYDVSDYCAIDPAYGTMDDFDELVACAAQRGMGIMLDMVLCHTSSEHAWFKQALAGSEKYRKYYILRDGRSSTGAGDPGEPPTNWQCAFGGSAWEWEPRLGKWYLHLHDVSQPDLDWTNPEVRAEAARVVRFWKERGVMGFRFDVVNLMSKPEKFEDDTRGLGRRLFADGPHIHEYLRELVEQTGIGSMITVGEMASTDLENCIRYTRPEDHELSMAFSFHHLKVDYKHGKKWELMEPDISELRRIFRAWQEGMQVGGGWNALFWDNHDQPRAITRFGGRDGAGDQGTDWDHVGKMLAICIHLMQGTPYVYQGDELGMTNPGYSSISQFRDVESLNAYRALTGEGSTDAREIGGQHAGDMEGGSTSEEAVAVLNERSRDNGRTPMQWTSADQAGFSTGTSWIEVPENSVLINARAEVGVEGSMYEFYKRLIALRKRYEVISDGAVRFLDAGAAAPKVIAYERALADNEGAQSVADTPSGSGAPETGDAQPRRLVVVCSFDSSPCTAQLTREGHAVELDGLDVLVSDYDDVPQRGCEKGSVLLRPYEAVAYIA